MDYNKFFTDVAKRRIEAILPKLGREALFRGEKTYILHGGVPCSEVFPIKECNFTTKDGTVIRLSEEELNIAQQYGYAKGYLPLLEIIRDYQVRLHNPPSPNWTVMLSSGAQEGNSLTFQMFLNEGDYVIGGDHCYSGTLEILRPLNINYLPITQDKDGLIPSCLRRCLQEFDANLRNKLKILYVVPNGGNPEAYTLHASRRKQIYDIAQEYDLMILEDDSYQFILFDEPEQPPSFLSMDVDGRVIRCDSFSKTLGPGYRLGYITGPQPVIDKFMYKIQTSSHHPSGMSQLIVYKLLTNMGFDGYMRNCNRICDEFRKRSQIAVNLAEKWLKNVATWEKPSGGLFLWIRLNDVIDSDEIVKLARKKKAYFAPGNAFKYDNSSSPYIRISFSTASAEDLEEGFKILAESFEECK